MTLQLETVYGLDFGTTNSLLAVVTEDGLKTLVDASGRPYPSVVCFVGSDVITGRKAREMVEEAGLEVHDNVVPSPKRLLAQPGSVVVAGEAMDAEDIVGFVLAALKADASAMRMTQGNDVARAVMTVPISMDGRARRRLRQAALRQGIEVIQFVHEPLAALYGSLRRHPDSALRLNELAEGLALVVDWGGGTLDLTLCTYSGGMLLQIQNFGDDQVGGGFFDDALVNLVIKRHMERYGLTEATQLMPGARQQLRMRCEVAKINLSSRDETTVALRDCFGIDPGSPSDDARSLGIAITRADLHEATGELVRRGIGAVEQLLASARRDAASVTTCLLVGGMASMPAIQEGIAGLFGVSRIDLPEHGDRLIAEGAAWIAHDKVRVSLAKPFELSLARNTIAEVAPPDTVLPHGGTISRPFPLHLYCADPRDGTAVLRFTRPLWPGRASLADDRAEYLLLRLPVDAGAAPMMERLEVVVRFTADCTAQVDAISLGTGEVVSGEVHDLEFGLRIPGVALDEKASDPPPIASGAHDALPGDVLMRANVAGGSTWAAVPGDLFRQHRKEVDMTSIQRAEALYYQPCSACGMTPYETRAAGGCGYQGCDQRELP